MNPSLRIVATASSALLLIFSQPAWACGEGGETEGCGGDCSCGPWIAPTALLQVWGTAWDQDLDPVADPAGYGDPEDDPGYKIRRGRIGVEGGLGHDLYYSVVFGVSSPYDAWKSENEDVGLVDAWLQYDVGVFTLTAGQQKAPYSREQLISAGDLVFTERSVAVEHMAPDRETGVVGTWTWKGIEVRAGTFNGSGSFLGNESRGQLFVERLGWSNDLDAAYRTWGRTDRLVLGAAVNTLQDNNLTTRTMGFGADLIVRWQGISALAEVHGQNLTPTDSNTAQPDVQVSTSRMGAMGQLGYSIGMLEPAVRFSLYDDDDASGDNGDVAELVGGVTLHMADDMARFGAGYVHRVERVVEPISNDTARVWAQVRY